MHYMRHSKILSVKNNKANCSAPIIGRTIKLMLKILASLTAINGEEIKPVC
jgi:hypothetical protein